MPTLTTVASTDKNIYVDVLSTYKSTRYCYAEQEIVSEQYVYLYVKRTIADSRYITYQEDVYSSEFYCATIGNPVVNFTFKWCTFNAESTLNRYVTYTPGASVSVINIPIIMPYKVYDERYVFPNQIPIAIRYCHYTTTAINNKTVYISRYVKGTLHNYNTIMPYLGINEKQIYVMTKEKFGDTNRYVHFIHTANNEQKIYMAIYRKTGINARPTHMGITLYNEKQGIVIGELISEKKIHLEIKIIYTQRNIFLIPAIIKYNEKQIYYTVMRKGTIQATLAIPALLKFNDKYVTYNWIIYNTERNCIVNRHNRYILEQPNNMAININLMSANDKKDGNFYITKTNIERLDSKDILASFKDDTKMVDGTMLSLYKEYKPEINFTVVGKGGSIVNFNEQKELVLLNKAKFVLKIKN